MDLLENIVGDKLFSYLDIVGDLLFQCSFLDMQSFSDARDKFHKVFFYAYDIVVIYFLCII